MEGRNPRRAQAFLLHALTAGLALAARFGEDDEYSLVIHTLLAGSAAGLALQYFRKALPYTDVLVKIMDASAHGNSSSYRWTSSKNNSSLSRNLLMVDTSGLDELTICVQYPSLGRSFCPAYLSAYATQPSAAFDDSRLEPIAGIMPPGMSLLARIALDSTGLANLGSFPSQTIGARMADIRTAFLLGFQWFWESKIDLGSLGSLKCCHVLVVMILGVLLRARIIAIVNYVGSLYQATSSKATSDVGDPIIEDVPAQIEDSVVKASKTIEPPAEQTVQCKTLQAVQTVKPPRSSLNPSAPEYVPLELQALDDAPSEEHPLYAYQPRRFNAHECAGTECPLFRQFQAAHSARRDNGKGSDTNEVAIAEVTPADIRVEDPITQASNIADIRRHPHEHHPVVRSDSPALSAPSPLELLPPSQSADMLNPDFAAVWMPIWSEG